MELCLRVSLSIKQRHSVHVSVLSSLATCLSATFEVTDLKVFDEVHV